MALKTIVNILSNYIQKYDNLVLADKNIFQFHIDNLEKQDSFFEFYLNYKQTFTVDSYLNFDWADKSTGQKALLNIYSRLNYLSDKEISRRGSNLVLNEDIILLIDEGELYLHPTWQKEILFQLLNILPVIFKRDYEADGKPPRNIQITFTSNSPLIIISDIPSTNIVFLSKSGDSSQFEVRIQDSLNDQKQTFAANIHTLLSDSFFMKNGLMGDFAFHKINEIIEYLQGSIENIEANKEKILKTILMIGEPVIKSKLIQMLNERLSLDMIELNGRISQLEKEVKLLKRK